MRIVTQNSCSNEPGNVKTELKDVFETFQKINLHLKVQPPHLYVTSADFIPLPFVHKDLDDSIIQSN